MVSKMSVRGPERTSRFGTLPLAKLHGAAGRGRGQGGGSGAHRGGRARAGPGAPSPCGMPVHPAVFLCYFGSRGLHRYAGDGGRARTQRAGSWVYLGYG